MPIGVTVYAMDQPGPSTQPDDLSNFDNMDFEYESDEDDEDDPVVAEYPLMLSSGLKDSLYLLQFPYNVGTNTDSDSPEDETTEKMEISVDDVKKNNDDNDVDDDKEFSDADCDDMVDKPSTSCEDIPQKEPNNSMKVKRCRVRPKNGQISLEIEINQNASNFDAGRAEQIAKQVEGASGNKNVIFENGLVDRVFLKSEKIMPNADNYFVAAFNGKEVHLNQLKDILRLKPDFSYLHQGLKRKKEAAKDSGSNADSEDQAGPSKPQQVSVKLKKLQDPEKKVTQTLSYPELEAKRNEEPWIECEWHDEGSDHSIAVAQRLFSKNLEPVNLDQDSDCLKQMIPENKESQPLEPTLPSHVLSMQALQALPLQEQCKQLLMRVKIIQFSQIVLLLGIKGVTTDALLKAIQKVAVLVKGNWVVKSEILYPDNTVSDISGVPAELMCRARDYMLYLFTTNQYVQRKKLSSLLRIPAEELELIFSGVSKRTHNKGWELSQPPDYDFLNKYSDLAQRQALFWEHRYKSLSSFLDRQTSVRRKSKSASDSDGGGKIRTGSISCSDNESGTESKGVSPLMAKKFPAPSNS